MLVIEKKENLLPVKAWVTFHEDIESGAWDQINNLRKLPFAFDHIAIMSDVHQGYGMCIGGVLATLETIIPNCVGVDIGCGMLAMKLEGVSEINPDTLKVILGEIRKEIPVGFSRRANPLLIGIPCPEMSIIEQEWKTACISMGTLGGGELIASFAQ